MATELQIERKKMKKLREKYELFRPRTFVEASFALTKSENDIIDIIMSMIGVEEDKDENLEYTINVKDYIQLFGLEHGRNAYPKIKASCRSLHKKYFSIYSSDDGKWTDYSWIQTATYIENHGMVIIKLAEDFKRMMVDTKKKGGSSIFYSLRFALPMEYQYSKRIYYMCLEWINTTHIRFDNMEDLKRKLMIPKSYNNSMIQSRILDVAVKEVNEKSDIIISYTTVLDKGRGGTYIKGISWNCRRKTRDEMIACFGQQWVESFYSPYIGNIGKRWCNNSDSSIGGYDFEQEEKPYETA